MLLRRNRTRENASGLIWPGFVDSLSALLLVLMFLLSIFMIVQFVLRDRITGQQNKLNALAAELSQLGDLLAMEREKSTGLEASIERMTASLMTSLIDRDAAAARLSASMSPEERFQTLLAALASERDLARSEKEQTAATLAITTSERDALKQSTLTLEEKLAALELALEAQRKKAEETLELLAAAEAAKSKLDAETLAKAAQADRATALAAVAQQALKSVQERDFESRKAVALLNAQVLELRRQLSVLSAQLDAAEAKDAENQAQIAALGQKLNAALAQKVSELQRYRSEFFGKMREVLSDRRDIRIEGDRFVLQSEVLFASGSAEIGPAGQAELARVAKSLAELATQIPADVDWVLRVDGHTDKLPVVGDRVKYRDNWELSQARALAVVRLLAQESKLPPHRLAAAGFGEFAPLDKGTTPAALARNRRIEMKFDLR